MNIIKSFEDTFNRAKDKNWNTIYILVDIHDTIFKACWENEEKYEYFPFAKECLQELTKCRPFIKMILWSSSHQEKLYDYREKLKEDNIIFEYINSNPEVDDTKLASFKYKFYFNIGIDNAFGFEAEKDWKVIYDYLIKLTNLKNI